MEIILPHVLKSARVQIALAFTSYSTKISLSMKNMKTKMDSEKGKKIGITPVGDRVLVRPFRDQPGEKTKSGIYIPETVEKEKPAEGEVIAVGDGWYTKDGTLMPLRLKVGDNVIFSKYSYEEVKIDGEDYYILKEENIFTVIN